MNLELEDWLDWLATEPQRPWREAAPALGLEADTMFGFCVGTEDPNSGLPALRVGRVQADTSVTH